MDYFWHWSYLMGATQQILLAGGGSGVTDPDFSSVTLLIPMNGSNGGTTFTDVATAKTITPTGWTTSTAQSKWGGSSGLGAGAGARLVAADSSSDFLYTADFSIEVWVYFSSSIRQYIWDHQSLDITTLIVTPSSGLTELYHAGIGYIINAGSTPFNTSQWYFLQVVRSGTLVTIGRDGSSYQTGTQAATLGSSTSLIVGNRASSTDIPFSGHMQDFRVTNGVARSIAVPSAAFPTS